MPQANINDRASVERLYPREAFHDDARRNALGNTPVLHGLRLTGGADESGAFEFSRSAKHAGEPDSGAGAVFVAPRIESESGPGDAYAAFLDGLVELARSLEVPAIGRGDERLKGFRGG